MLTLPTGSSVFAIAGLVAAAVPIIIHLLNRRSFRDVKWAAMEFLKASAQQNKRLLHFRDLVLMALRALVLLLFGLALARPYFSNSVTKLKPNQPIHAVLVIDNSLSMSYAKFNQSLLDEAKAKADKFIDELPDGSAISVIPLCGAQEGFSREAYRSKQDARDAVDHIRIMDRMADTAIGADLALRACRGVVELPTKRVVFLGDQQAVNWPTGSAATLLKELPGVQIASIAPDLPDNTWIDQFILQDGLADTETPTVFKVVVRHEGSTARKNLPVTLSIDGTEIESRVIDLEPGQTRELTFAYTFNVQTEPGKAVFVPARISIPPDRLKDDDARNLAVPVVSQLPVLFVDQWGENESPVKNRYGETYSLRRLLTPFHATAGKTAASIRHLRFEQLDRKALEDARLVVMAGVTSPDSAGTVKLLREFVEQGGQLFIAAGGGFDPVAWNDAAWRNGSSILPLSLDVKPIGQLPEAATEELKTFRLASSSLAGEYFDLAETAPEDLQALYGVPLFFKAVRANDDEKIVAGMLKLEAERLDAVRRTLKESDQRIAKLTALESKNKLGSDDRQARVMEEQKRGELLPGWLLWAPKELTMSGDVPASELAAKTRPRVVASYDNGAPFLIHRNVGRGQIIMMTSGAFSSWNTLPRTHAVLLFHRILRSMLLDTLPRRNLSSIEPLTLPVTDRNALYTLTRPDGTGESLTAEAISTDEYGLIVRNANSRGLYKITATRQQRGGDADTLDRLWDVSFAVNGPGRESEPAVLNEGAFKERLGADSTFRWVNRADTVRIEGDGASGRNIWKWLIVAVMFGLIAECLLLAWPRLKKERVA